MGEEGGCPGMVEERWCPLARLTEHNLEWVVQRILLHLDLASLHVARQVCRRWDQLVLALVWGSRRGRARMEERLRAQWRGEEPYKRSWLLPHRKGFYLAASGSTIGLGTLDNTALLVQEGQVLLLLPLLLRLLLQHLLHLR